MLAVVAALFILGLILAAIDWRKGMFVCVTVGFLQDPIRKLTPGEPIYITVLVGLFFGVMFLGAMVQRRLPRLKRIHEWRALLRAPVSAFVVVVLLQALHTLLRFGSPILAGIGLFAYLMPLPAMWLSYLFAGRVKGLLIYYSVLAALVAAGVYLSFLGLDWSVLGQVGPGLVISSQGQMLEAHAGFLRSPEIAAWHVAAGACFLVILGALTTKSSVRSSIGLLFVFLAGAGLLTGRRKMLGEIVVFIGIYVCLLAYYRKGATKVAAVGLVAALAAVLFSFHVVDPVPEERSMDPYLQRGVTGFEDATERFEKLGLRSLVWAVQRHGWWGAGAGTGSQGAQYFGGGASLVGGASEGGLGKVLVELGLPGLLVLVWLNIAVLRHVARTLEILPTGSRDIAIVTYGLLAFLTANALTFMIASQVFGDFFVLLILGWTMGFVLASPHLALRHHRTPLRRGPAADRAALGLRGGRRLARYGT